jgi:nitrogen-specific signal transduction histidine kinase
MMKKQKRLEEELQQAQKLEAVGTLAGGVAHDFNNLLQTIQGFSEMLLFNKDEDDASYRAINRIMAAVDRGGRLTRQLLAYSRKVKSVRHPINLNLQVYQAHSLLERTIPKTVKIELDLEEELELVDADSIQIEQVLMNLVINAIDAMTNGGRITIKTENVTIPLKKTENPTSSIPWECVVLSVSDNGYGMEEDILDQIFDPFFSTKAPGKGTGLGLSMVLGIVDSHDGRITCQSKPGEGTSFQICLPVSVSVLEKRPVQETCDVQSGSETILLVDDNEIIQQTGKAMLEKAGYEVLTASTGEMALDIYEQETEKIDMVLLDLIMPGMGGANCLQELLKKDPSINVIITSGYSPVDHTMQKNINSNTREFLRKPFTYEQLRTTVRNVLDSKSPLPVPAVSISEATIIPDMNVANFSA